MNKDNLLSKESSPYLKQHKDNPVNWQAWSNQAFELAKTQNKPIFLSIGYSSCYWCHVMEKDSFESNEVAKILNTNFICIKVDREERQDVDEIYMSAVVALTGHGGWPLSVFLTPEQKPFWGGTFFYKAQFIKILEKIAELWQSDLNNIMNSANQITSYLINESGANSNRQKDEIEDRADLKSNELHVIRTLLKNADLLNGGFGREPKFPPHIQLSFLIDVLKINFRENNLNIQDITNLNEAIRTTLNKMYCGGIFDHVGGGFHRYSTDSQWKIPHFEKMLYDNAVLISLYCKGYGLYRDKTYLKVIEETLDFCEEILFSKEDNAFYSALDAGEVGKEGEYYVWQEDELKSLLNNDELALLNKYSDVSNEGNFENKQNIMFINNPELLDKTELFDKFKTVCKKLSEYRKQRQKPFLDYKVITSWNGLFIEALIDASIVFQTVPEKQHLAKALINKAQIVTDSILEKLHSNASDNEVKLKRIFCDKESKIDAQLDDYAYLISALIKLFLAIKNDKYIEKAKILMQEQISFFWDNKRNTFYQSADKTLLVKKSIATDGVLPSALAVTILNLIKLNEFYSEDTDFINYANKTYTSVKHNLTSYPTATIKLLEAGAILAGGVLHYFYKPTEENLLWINELKLNSTNQEMFTELSDNLEQKLGGKYAFYLKQIEEANSEILLCDNKSCRIWSAELLVLS